MKYVPKPYRLVTSVLANLPPTAHDEQVGAWSRQQLEQMDRDFVERLERAIALGLERRQGTRGAGGLVLGHCGRHP